MKYVPNALSILRLTCLIPLILLRPFTLPFTIVYLVAIVSDMLDGPIARKFKIATPFGATLDSIADFFLVVVMLVRLIPIIDFSNWILTWITFAIVLRALSIAIAFIRYKRIAFIHTYFNKFFSFILCLFPFLYLFLDADAVFTVILVIAMIAFFEELWINITSKELDLDHKGILFNNK